MMVIVYIIDNTLHFGCTTPYKYVFDGYNSSIISIISEEGVELRGVLLPFNHDNYEVKVIGVDDV